MHTEAHLFSLPNDCLWYDKLWGPSQRVVTLLVAVRIMMRIMMVSTQLVGSGSGLTDSSMASPTLDEAAYWTFQFFSV